MILRTDNPYANGFVEVDSEEGLALLQSRPINYTPDLGDKFHPIVDGDTLMLISDQYYGSSRWWHLIFRINELENPFDLTSGAVIIIPSINRYKAMFL
jgi:nucleoid-associated protein YgaU